MPHCLPYPFDWIQRDETGIFIVPGGFYIDPSRACTSSVISHAHGDHFPRHTRNVFASHATLELRREQASGNYRRDAISWRKPVQIGETKVSLFPAGHVPGSAQILVEYKGMRMLYSGDIQDGNPTHCEPLEIPSLPVDLLICESTFGLVDRHPPEKEEILKMLESAGKRPILAGAYPLGKTQRLTILLNEFVPDRKVYLHEENYRTSMRCRELGYEAGEFHPYRKKDFREGEPGILILPPKMLPSFNRDTESFKTMASGWNQKLKIGVLDAAFYLSDHADANGLKEYVKGCHPKSIHFHHGYPEKLEGWARESGIEVIRFHECI